MHHGQRSRSRVRIMYKNQDLGSIFRVKVNGQNKESGVQLKVKVTVKVMVKVKANVKANVKAKYMVRVKNQNQGPM